MNIPAIVYSLKRNTWGLKDLTQERWLRAPLPTAYLILPVFCGVIVTGLHHEVHWWPYREVLVHVLKIGQDVRILQVDNNSEMRCEGKRAEEDSTWGMESFWSSPMLMLGATAMQKQHQAKKTTICRSGTRSDDALHRASMGTQYYSPQWDEQTCSVEREHNCPWKSHTESPWIAWRREGWVQAWQTWRSSTLPNDGSGIRKSNLALIEGKGDRGNSREKPQSYFSPLGIQSEQTDKTGDLEEEVDEDGASSIQGEGTDSRHVCEGSKKEGKGFWEAG